MNISDFAKKVGVHPLTVRRWIRERKITAARKQLKGFTYYWDIDENEIKKVIKDDSTRS